ncbi:hypothetical protein QBC46DRAFT_19674 [Diplogelasinospora grovesii]|uniref:NmrA-like domain-containing protein n=1 Tax=Diplogelasinospora grovesii TaxID=303347 RepID=A0AAN6N253_9PEZI|nr:hypothetical protein QBC46DRAFT_19674 [Diplogelasinospora grovesii]
MAKIVSIVGATGAQGRGVIAAFANDPAYRVRAITRNPQSAASRALAAQPGIAEVVQADLDDVESLKAAFAGSAIIFGVTNFFEPFAAHGPERAVEVEARQGINLATAAASALSTLEHYIWSTLPDGKAVSAGKYVVPHFEAKNRADAFIRRNEALLRRTTFLWVTWYHSNYVSPMFKPYWIPTAEKHVQFASYAPGTPVTTIGDVSVNLAQFVRAIVTQGNTAGGAIVLAAIETSTAENLLHRWAKAKGTKAQFVQVDGKTYRDLWPRWAEEMGVMMEYWDEYREKSWTAANGQKVLTKDDLNISGMQSLDEAYKGLEL